MAASTVAPRLLPTQPTTPQDAERHREYCLQLFVDHLRAAARDPKTIASYEADLKRFSHDAGKDLLDVDRTTSIGRWKPGSSRDGRTPRCRGGHPRCGAFTVCCLPPA